MSTKKLLAIIVLMVSIQVGRAQENIQEKFKKVEWLVGKWTRTNANGGESGYETWTKVSDSKLSGKGVTLKGTKVVFVENLEFILQGSNIFYTVIISGEKKPVYFKLTAVSSDGFTCENPSHDFPKKITYIRRGNNIKAVISGNGKSVDYLFTKEK